MRVMSFAGLVPELAERERRTLRLSPPPSGKAASSDLRPSTQLGESVMVVGSHPALGAWDPAKGIPLPTTESMFPVWAGKVVLPRGERIAWKAVIVGPYGVRREQGEDRVLETSPRGAAGAWLARFRDGTENAPVPAPAGEPDDAPTAGLIDAIPH